MRDATRVMGAKALGAGLLCWAVNVGFMLAVGRFSPMLVLLGSLGVLAGAVLVVWGEGYQKMTTAQKVPAALIAVLLVGLTTALLLRWLPAISHR